MLINKVRKKVRADLESPPELRQFGTGWISGSIALVASIAGLLLVLCLRYPTSLTIPQIRPYYENAWFRVGLHILLIASFVLAAISMALRKDKILGFSAMTLTLLATILGGTSGCPVNGELLHGAFLGLDWFILNLILTGLLFVPLEKLFAHNKSQPIFFREDWREDLFYFLISSILVQALTFLSLSPALLILSHTKWTAFRAWVGSQPVVLQFFEIMFLTDLVQYWLHRAFHRIPFLWGFHAVHHSAKSLDWIAGARMHFFEIVILRGTTVIPMYILGFGAPALYAYVFLVYVHSTFLHANVGWNFDRIGRFLATPRFHHWHHGIEKEAIDVNFSIHFPLFDRMFGTYYLPPGKWPTGYGVGGHPVPPSYFRQFLYPFLRKPPTTSGETSNP
jgi:sterol desaturase/sphingolipid hydroxylase (fatty acid hydroxylase superfamily)